MKKNVLNNLEKIKKERKISKEVEKNIFETVIANGAIGISISILIFAFIISANFLTKAGATLIYNISAMIFLIFAIVIIEIAYKKDSGELAVTAVELLVISLFTLLSPHIFIRINYGVIYSFIVFVSVYYIFKIIRIYFSEKEKYLNEISDITDIIKKESKDELAKQEQQKREEQRKILQEKEKQETKKKTTRKNTTAKSKATKPKTNTKKQTTKNNASIATKKSVATKESTSNTTKKATTTKKKKINEGE